VNVCFYREKRRRSCDHIFVYRCGDGIIVLISKNAKPSHNYLSTPSSRSPYSTNVKDSPKFDQSKTLNLTQQQKSYICPLNHLPGYVIVLQKRDNHLVKSLLLFNFMFIILN
jgi:hypothetical protein